MQHSPLLYKTGYANSHALIIGIDNYNSAPPLSCAVSDAEGVREVLVNDLNFLESNITCLTNEEATRDKILKAYLTFGSEKIEIDDRIFVFFAGHGDTRAGNKGDVGFLVPVDADISDLSTLIRWDTLTKNAELIRAKHILFIMDACYGGLALTRNVNPGSTRFLKDMLHRSSRQVLAAGKANEVVADSGGPLPNHSVFTGHLIEGLRGKATTDDRILTANGLMSYVYGKVANDENSHQTPHYGHFDGDGDFILRAPELEEPDNDTEIGNDRLIIIPVQEEKFSPETTQSKVKKLKSLLSNESTSIELHDFIIEETRSFLSGINEDNFSVQGNFSQQELLERIAKYENISNDLLVLMACISYWAKLEQRVTLQKVLSRSTDHLGSQSGLAVWSNLRYYPAILQLYSSGIAAVEGQNYKSLFDIFYSRVARNNYGQNKEYFVELVSEGILNLKRDNIFNKLPGHERQLTPMSEYLFKMLQPKLDDVLFIGKNYEKSFDEFEILFALVSADTRNQHGDSIWGPIGRFGWKHERGNGPLSRLISEAKSMGENWTPLEVGFFGGDITRFETLANLFEKNIFSMGWR